jgi:hypothetical protein
MTIDYNKRAKLQQEIRWLQAKLNTSKNNNAVIINKINKQACG